jgi:hypothetical protein
MITPDLSLDESLCETAKKGSTDFQILQTKTTFFISGTSTYIRSKSSSVTNPAGRFFR